uniref:Uncharacterized protein n=1 Tax=Nymphaea colorata TaxID=210225 RepID=A0A5K1FKB7_9MAGN
MQNSLTLMKVHLTMQMKVHRS